jgi:hypothetical protein
MLAKINLLHQSCLFRTLYLSTRTFNLRIVFRGVHPNGLFFFCMIRSEISLVKGQPVQIVRRPRRIGLPYAERASLVLLRDWCGQRLPIKRFHARQIEQHIRD